MTMLYRTIEITSSEQAAHLPPGTIARHGQPHSDAYVSVLRLIKGERVWESLDAGMLEDADMIGWVALVEAEEAEESPPLRPARRLQAVGARVEKRAS